MTLFGSTCHPWANITGNNRSEIKNNNRVQVPTGCHSITIAKCSFTQLYDRSHILNIS